MSQLKNVLITGANGQLAKELKKTAPPDVELFTVTREEMNIADRDSVQRCLDRIRPELIINAAAYTAVDQAEQDQDTAMAVNAEGIAHLAACSTKGTYLLHISTDFVFDGSKNTPYGVDDAPNPQSVYGQTKYQGEQALFAAKPTKSAVIRTAWVYSAEGKNFVQSMLRFMQQRDSLNIVVDQVGTPTWAKGLAQVCWASCQQQLEGVFHWSDAGVASWYDFAEAIQQLGVEHDLLDKAIVLNAIPTSAYPLPAPRPAYSVLDKSKLLAALPNVSNHHWLSQLKAMFTEMSNEPGK